MMSDNARPRATDLFAALLIGSAGVMALALQPLLLGPLVGIGLIDNAMLGWIAFAETLALGIVSLFGPDYLMRGGMRIKLLTAGMALVLLNILTTAGDSAAQLLLLRMLCGMAEGMILSGAVLVMLATASPDRINAAFLAGSTTISGAISYFIPTVIIPAYGAKNVFVVLAISAAVAVVALILLRFRPEAGEEGVTHWRKWPIAAYLVLAGLVLQNAAIGAAWAFLERVGAIEMFKPEILGLSASLGLAGQVAGPILVVVVAHRLPATPALVLACLCQAGSVLVLGAPHSPAQFIGASVVMGLLWIGSFPFALKLELEVEASGRAAIYCVSAQMFGLAFGPAIAASLVGDESVYPAYAAASALLVIAAVFYGFAGGVHRATLKQL